MLEDPGTGTELIPRNEVIPTKEAGYDNTKHRFEIAGADAAMKRYHQIHFPTCLECKQSWPYPRNVSFLADVPQDMRNGDSLSSFVPVSKETLVAYQTWDRQTQQPHFQEKIYQRLKLTHSLIELRKRRRIKSLLTCKGKLEYHRLVKEFDYNRKTGDVIHCSEYSDGEQEIDFRYARLLTLNSWYVALVANILNIIMDVCSLATGVMMLGLLYSPGGGYDLPRIKSSRHFFAFWYFGCLLVAIFLAIKAARWEFKAHSSPSVGDMIVKCHRFDRFLSFAALTVFIFLGVDKLIKDIVKILHPWKSVHPHAAVKVEGVRVHVVGYKSRPLFHVENSSGQLGVLSVLALNKLSTLIYSVWLIIIIRLEGGKHYQVQYTLIFYTALSTISAAFAIYKIAKLHRYRRLLKTELLRILKFAEIRNDPARKGPARKLLALHFHQGYKADDESMHKVTSSQIKVSEESNCSLCGRAKRQTQGDQKAAQGIR